MTDKLRVSAYRVQFLADSHDKNNEVFLRDHVGEGRSEFRTRWRKAVFTGRGAMLKECNSEAALLDYFAITLGAIGYVSRISGGDGVKVLIVTP